MERYVRIIDSTLRDGTHAVSHQFSVKDMVAIASALDKAGVPVIEVGHGDGLGGSSYQYGFSKDNEFDYFRAVAEVLTETKLAVLLLPGIGSKKMLQKAYECGARMVRVATHVTEADIAQQHIQLGKELGMETIGFLMMSHMASPEVLLQQAQLMESYGADVVYVTDSAGALIPAEVSKRIRLLKDNLSCKIGFHAHNNLGLAIGNSLAALEAGADYLDGTTRSLGAGAGNAQTEVLVALLNKLGYKTGIDLYKIMDAGEKEVVPRMRELMGLNATAVMLGYTGVYGSFLLHTLRVAQQLGVEPRDILVELGRRGVVGGQEDMIVDVAVQLQNKKCAS